jgi:glucose/arabinose dehydrogenase
MNIAHVSVRAAACLLLATSAQASAQAGAADPQAAVPATTYRPALGYKVEAAPAASPDRQWKESNATVAATHSMSLTMKGMGTAVHQHPVPLSPVKAIEAQSGAAAPTCMPSGGEGKQGCCCGGAGMEGCCCKDKMKSASLATGGEHEHKESP